MLRLHHAPCGLDCGLFRAAASRRRSTLRLYLLLLRDYIGGPAGAPDGFNFGTFCLGSRMKASIRRVMSPAVALRMVFALSYTLLMAVQACERISGVASSLTARIINRSASSFCTTSERSLELERGGVGDVPDAGAENAPFTISDSTSSLEGEVDIKW